MKGRAGIYYFIFLKIEINEKHIKNVKSKAAKTWHQD